MLIHLTYFSFLFFQWLQLCWDETRCNTPWCQLTTTGRKGGERSGVQKSGKEIIAGDKRRSCQNMLQSCFSVNRTRTFIMSSTNMSKIIFCLLLCTTMCSADINLGKLDLFLLIVDFMGEKQFNGFHFYIS